MPYIFEHDDSHLAIYGKDTGIVGQDYVADTELTASNTFVPENVGTIEFTGALIAVIQAAQAMDKFKKAMFRKRTREESDLPPMPEDDVALSIALGPVSSERFENLFHGIVGCITEVGEQAEILYAMLAEDKEPDITNVREEIGDNLWYLARLVKFAETTFPAEMRRNIAKLRARHGTEGFSKEGDINRNLDAEHKLLEGTHVFQGQGLGLEGNDEPDEA